MFVELLMPEKSMSSAPSVATACALPWTSPTPLQNGLQT